MPDPSSVIVAGAPLRLVLAVWGRAIVLGVGSDFARRFGAVLRGAASRLTQSGVIGNSTI
jgi:hypothetical protein